MPSFEGLSDDYVLQQRDRVRRLLAETPEHLYPMSNDDLTRELRELNAELSRRRDSVAVHYDELEVVGDDGTLEDALWRLQQRQQG